LTVGANVEIFFFYRKELQVFAKHRRAEIKKKLTKLEPEGAQLASMFRFGYWVLAIGC
jgi:hypothetical protein